MPTKREIENWVCDALRALDNSADSAEICRIIWENHEHSLRDSGRQFYTWQREVERALGLLKRRGLVRRPSGTVSRGQWQMVGDLTNSFEAMCRRAKDEQWCWNLCCQTCPNHDIRFGLIQIGWGRHPVSHEWDRFDTQNPQSPESPSIRHISDWPEAVKRQLSDVLTAASLQNLAEDCSFPDWLGYLGVVLDFTGDDEVVAMRLSNSWLPQLRMMVERGSPSRTRLDEVRASGRPLKWSDIDGLERDIIRV